MSSDPGVRSAKNEKIDQMTYQTVDLMESGNLKQVT